MGWPLLDRKRKRIESYGKGLDDWQRKAIADERRRIGLSVSVFTVRMGESTCRKTTVIGMHFKT